jgi:DNA polymerase (family 10)
MDSAEAPSPRPPPLWKEFLILVESRLRLARASPWGTRLRGDLQMHTNWSDGSGATRYEFIAITDHSKGLSIANGINEAKLKKKSVEIEAVNHELRASVGDLTVLHSLDILLGSFHSALRRKEDQTERYLAALRNPHIQILGHPRGRIYNYRPGLRADWETIFCEATQLDKAVEIDAYPDR